MDDVNDHLSLITATIRQRNMQSPLCSLQQQDSITSVAKVAFKS
jgi:hypothetical protein